MGSMTLIVDRRGASVELTANRVVCVRSPEGEAQRVGLLALRHIVVQGDVALSSRLLRACNEAGVGIVLVSTRGALQVAHVFPFRTSAVRLRLSHYRLWADSERRLGYAARLVAWKIQRQAESLNASGLEVPLERYVTKVYSATSLESLMGVEGASSARYYGVWQQVWKDPWSFTRRSRRPPRDPVNALLSLGYTLATQYVGRLAALRGLDPAIGFLHRAQNQRPALALDLVEPLRPLVDYWVWQWLSQGSGLAPENFRSDGSNGVRLDKEGRQRFYRAWFNSEEEWLGRRARDVLADLLRVVRPGRDQMVG